MEDTARQDVVDTEHLRLLRIGYFIAAGTNLIWVFFPLLYVAMGAMMLAGSFGSSPGAAPPREFGLIFVVLGGTVSALMAALTLLKFLTARAIGNRTSRTLILITAAVSCLGIPWGTALGVLTLLVLSRPSVASQFERAI